MAIESTDIFMAARLIQWGLQPKIRPVQQQEYRELIREYLNRSEFQMIVREMSDGLGLYVLNVTEHGIVLSPREESVFRMKASEFRPSNSTSDLRLLDGLVEITIAATVFPRERDLDDDVNRPRPPVTIDEIEEQLRSLCDKLAEKFKEVDPAADDMETGLYDAWRVYANTMSARETKDNRQASKTTRRIIEYNLMRLKDFGCFTEARYNGKPAWQPTRRYNVLVTELAAFRLYSTVTDILNHKDDTDLSMHASESDFEDAFSEPSASAFADAPFDDGLGGAENASFGEKDDGFSDDEETFDEENDNSSGNGETFSEGSRKTSGNGETFSEGSRKTSGNCETFSEGSRKTSGNGETFSEGSRKTSGNGETFSEGSRKTSGNGETFSEDDGFPGEDDETFSEDDGFPGEDGETSSEDDGFPGEDDETSSEDDGFSDEDEDGFWDDEDDFFDDDDEDDDEDDDA